MFDWADEVEENIPLFEPQKKTTASPPKPTSPERPPTPTSPARGLGGGSLLKSRWAAAPDPPEEETSRTENVFREPKTQYKKVTIQIDPARSQGPKSSGRGRRNASAKSGTSGQRNGKVQAGSARKAGQRRGSISSTTRNAKPTAAARSTETGIQESSATSSTGKVETGGLINTLAAENKTESCVKPVGSQSVVNEIKASRWA